MRSPQQQTQATNNRVDPGPDRTGEFVAAVLGSTEAQWNDVFAQNGRTYEAPTLVMFSGATPSACGYAQSAMGPFYCPNDRKVYLDTSFLTISNAGSAAATSEANLANSRRRT